MKNKTLTQATRELEKNYNIKVKLELNKGKDESYRKTEVKHPLRTLFNKRYRKRTILATSIATLQGMVLCNWIIYSFNCYIHYW